MSKVTLLHLSRRQWAKRINDKWRDYVQRTVEGIFDIGRDLLNCKADSKHGEFTQFVQGDLLFNVQVARMFMAVAGDRRLQKREIFRVLPPHYDTLYKITRLDDEQLQSLIEDHTIRPDCKGGDIAKVLRLARVHEDERRVLELRPVEGKFRTLVIDPAWDYEWLSIGARAKPGYAMQSLEDLRAVDLMQWAESECHLWCWTTNNFSYEAHKLVEYWGFQHRTILTWVKPPPFGMGSYLRNATEHVLFATLGDTTTRPAAVSISTVFEAPRGEHSEKPEQFYDIVRAASYPPYGEANQRKARPDFINLYESVEDGREAAE